MVRAIAEKYFGRSEPGCCVACDRPLEEDPSGLNLCPECFKLAFDPAHTATECAFCGKASKTHACEECYKGFEEMLMSLQPAVGDSCKQPNCSGRLALLGVEAQFMCDTCGARHG